jgi:hypothetical protein
MITSDVPEDWRALQDDVARILNECGMEVEVEKPVATARGEVAVDVFARETVKGRAYTLLTECKNWTRNVPQTVIHAFRTVVAESGANIGYIVSSSGFQAGAFTAAELTNIRLLTWLEFQDDFEEAWVAQYLLPTVWERLDPLFSYTEPLVPRSFLEVDDEAVERLKELREKYGPFAWLMMTFTPFMQDLLDRRSGQVGAPKLPLRDRAPKELIDTTPSEILDAVGYREFLHEALDYGETAIEEFRDALARGGKGD